MGRRGPAPKRQSQRRRRNKPAPGAQVTTAPAGPPARDEVREPGADWHPIAVRFWEAFTRSGQVAFWEETDWAVAYDLCEELSHYKNAPNGKRNAAMRQAIDAVGARLLMTEGDRRRLRLELARGDVVDPDEQASVTKIADYMAKLGAGV